MTGGKQRKQQSFAPLERDALMRCDASTRLTLWMTGSTGEWGMGMLGAEGVCPGLDLLPRFLFSGLDGDFGDSVNMSDPVFCNYHQGRPLHPSSISSSRIRFGLRPAGRRVVCFGAGRH